MRTAYRWGILFLCAVALVFALGIVVGEATDRWLFGGAMIGGLLIAYSFVLLLLRKMGLVGPRKAER
ncbi:MAG TPA: hypothetical protein VJA65_03525 [bacterium]|nr:hypothetical protein [bacterium]